MFDFLKKRKQSQPSIGVELTNGRIAVAQVSYDPDQVPRLLLCDSRSLSDYNTSNQEKYEEEIALVYKSLVKKVKLKNFALNLTIKQTDRQLLLIEAPQVEDSELNNATRWKIKDMVEFNLDDAIIDVIKIPNIKELKRSPMIYAVVVKRKKIQKIIDLSNSCGNDLAIIDIPDMAQRNLAALLPEDQNGVAILSINSRNSLLTITRNGQLYLSRELETGFEQLLSQVQSDGGDNSSGFNDSTEALEVNSIALLQSLERMVLEVQRSLDYYEAQYSQPQINALFLAPFAYDIPEIKDYFSTQLGIKTKMLDFNDLFSTNEPLSHQLQSETFYAVGAALR